MRVLFAAEPEMEAAVRHRIDRALLSGQLRGPDGTTTYWELRSSQHSLVSDDEAEHAQRRS